MRLIALIFFVLFALSLALNFYLYSQLEMSGLDLEKAKVDFQSQAIERQPSVVTVTPPSAIETAFIDKNFPEALRLYSELLGENPELADSTRKVWFDTIRSAMADARENRRGHEYYELIHLFLQNFPYDPYFLYLEITDNLTRDDFTAVLASYYELRRNELPEDLSQVLENQINRQLRRMVDRLSDVGAWDILATMLESLLGYDPENRYLLVSLANAYAEQGQFSMMEGILTYLPSDDKEIKRLRNLQRIRTRQETDDGIASEGISLSKDRDHYLVSALVDDSEEVLLMIDTGASTTVVNSTTFDRLRRYNPEFLGRYTVKTAGGRVRGTAFKFASLAIGEYKVEDIAIMVLPVEDLQADGLLGMNFLRAFRFQLDQENAQLFLWDRDV